MWTDESFKSGEAAAERALSRITASYGRQKKQAS
jgi:hypothetical protein